MPCGTRPADDPPGTGSRLDDPMRDVTRSAKSVVVLGMR
jgi:hypothetical protein